MELLCHQNKVKNRIATYQRRVKYYKLQYERERLRADALEGDRRHMVKLVEALAKKLKEVVGENG